MAYDIRPLSFSEILDRAFRVLIDNFSLLFGIAALIMIPSEVLSSIGRLAGRVSGDLVTLIFIVVAMPVMRAALIVAAASRYLDRPISIRQAYKSARPIVWPIVGTYFLYGMIVFLVLVATMLTIVITRMFFAKASFVLGLSVLGLSALAAVGVYFTVVWSLVGSVMILERRFGALALRRSRELVRRSWWQTLGLVLAVLLVINAPAIGLRFLWGFIPVAGVVFRGVTQSIISAYDTVVFVIYYFDRRCRTEDFDLRLLAQQVRDATPSAMAPAPDSPALA